MIWLVPLNSDRERKFIVVAIISGGGGGDGDSNINNVATNRVTMATSTVNKSKTVRYPSMSKNNTLPLFYIELWIKFTLWYAVNAIFVLHKYGFIIQ